MLTEFFSAESLAALAQVLMVDLVLAGDNAIVVGMAAAGLAPELRRKAILVGIAAAAVLRIIFAALTSELLAIIGLTLAGGILLLWVAWKMWRELREPEAEDEGAELVQDHAETQPHAPKTLRQALTQIVIADVSMSLDNVLAVAGAARDHMAVMIIGLAMSVFLMGAASTIIARLLAKHRWIAYVGLAMIGFIAVRMIYDGADEVAKVVIGQGIR